MTAHRSAFAVAFLAALAALAWLAVRGKVPVDVGEAPRQESLETERPPPPGLLARESPDRAPPLPIGACSVSGTVRRRGKPVPATVEASRTRVAVRPSESVLLDAESSGFEIDLELPAVAARAQVGEDGSFRLDGLASGVWLLRAATPDGARGVALVTLAADGVRAEANVDVVSESRALRGTVSGADASPWRGTVHATQSRALGGTGNEDEDAFEPEVVVLALAVSTDDQGAFGIAGLHAGVCTLWVEDAGHRLSRTVRVPSDAPVEIRWPTPERAEGRVVEDATGSPIAGAAVEGSAWRGPLARRAVTLSDPEGRYVLPLSSPTWLSVRARGYVASAEGRVNGKGPDLVVRLVRTGTVRGQATRASDGTPVAGLVVEAADPTEGWARLGVPVARAITDSDGRYEMTEVPPGEVGIRVHGEAGVARGMSDISPDNGGHEPLDSDPLSVVLAPGGTATMDLLVEPAARITGAVTEADGTPAAGVLIGAWCPQRTYLHNRGTKRFWERAWTATGADGRYVLAGLVPGRTYHAVAARGAVRAEGATDAPASGGEATLDLRLPPSISFDVLVLDADSREAIAGIRIAVRPRDPWDAAWAGTTGEGGLLRVGPVRRSASATLDVLGPWTVVDGGDVSLASAPTAPARLRVRRQPPRPEAAAAWEDLARRVAADERPQDVLRVRVVSDAGVLVPRATLHYKNERRGSGNHGRAEVVDGFSSIPRRPGSNAVTFLAVVDARDPAGSPLPLGRGKAGPISSDVAETEVRLPPERVLVGRVLDGEGRGRPGLLVAAVDAAGEEDFMTERSSRGVRTGADGGFRIGGLAAEELVLTLATPLRWAEVLPRRVTAGGEPVEIRLHGSVTVAIHVREDGKPAPGAGVYAWRRAERDERLPWRASDTRSHSATTGDDGIARLEGLDPAGTYELRVSLDRGGEGREKERERRFPGWAPADATVEFGARRTIRGVVRDSAGTPVAGAHVFGWTGTVRTGHATTDASGAFELPDAGEGLRQVYAAMYEWGKGSWSGFVDAPQAETPASLTLDPGLALAVRLDGDAVADRSVLLTSHAARGGDADEYQFGRTDAAGTVAFRGLRADVPYTLWAGPRWDKERGRRDGTCGYLVGVTASATPSAVVLRVQAGGVIRVRLRGGWDSPSGTARHGLLDVDGELGSDGAMEFAGLCDVEWTLTVHDGPRRASARARPGADLVLSPEPAADKK